MHKRSHILNLHVCIYMYYIEIRKSNKIVLKPIHLHHHIRCKSPTNEIEMIESQYY